MSDEPYQEDNLENDDDILSKCGLIDIPPPPAPVQALDASGPRLMITKIVAKNFKSYGGVREMGPFHKNFTCVIGPNGSGKSNVIDSMLFVFGYRATKVRSRKLSQLIHNSELVPNASSCEVAVHFQKIIDHGLGANDYSIVPESCFTVSRRAYRDNSSSYWINDTRVVYKDVANLLRQHGIDLDHNRFLILQGEVEQIALMKPKAPTEHEDGFLEYLEDIIGSSRFKSPLTIYMDRIERLNDLRLEKLTRVKAVESEKDELEGTRNEAVGYLRLVNQVVRMKNILFQQNLVKERALEAEIKQRLNVANEEYQTLHGQITEHSREVDRLNVERDKLLEHQTDIQNQYRESKAKFSQCEADDSRLRDEHSHTKASGKKLVKALQAERHKLEELHCLPNEAGERRECINRQLAELEGTRRKHEEDYQSTVDNLAKETAPLRAKVEAAEEVLGPLQAEADSLNGQLTLERQRFDLAMAGQRREQERADVARKNVEAARARLAEREKEIVEAKAVLSPPSIGQGAAVSRSSGSVGVVGGLVAASKNLTEVKAKEDELSKSISELRAKLTESKFAMQADNSRDRILALLLEAKGNGSLPGIRGRLGSLAAIPPRYDVAVSTACGALDNIVTDTMETAQQAVVFLKQRNLGQATFIALDKMSKWAEKAGAPYTVPHTGSGQKVERLYDAIRFVEEDIRPAFYFALRDTLVAESLDVATKIAFGQSQRHRVVTLQGQLIETSGAMSGGGGRPSSGRMVTSVSQVVDAGVNSRRHSVDGGKRKSIGAVDLTELERKLATDDATLAGLREKRAHLEEVITRMTRKKEEAERTLKRCEVESVRLHAEINTLISEAESAQTRADTMGPTSKEQQEMRASLTKLETTVKKKTDAADKKREEVNKLKTQLMDVGSARLTAVQSRLEAIERKTKETREQLTKLEVSLKTTARNMTKVEAKVASMESELEAAKTKLGEIDAKLTDLEELGRNYLAEFQKIRKEGDELQQTIEAVQQQIATAQRSREAAQKAEASAHRAIAQLEAELGQVNGKAKQCQRDLRALRLHRIDDVVDEDVSSQSLEETGLTMQADVARSRELATYTAEQLQELSVNQQEMHQIEQRIAGMAPNMAAIEEYRRKAETYLARVGELNQVTVVLGEQRRLMEEAKAKRLSEFLNGFQAITNKLKEMYQMITQGGDAELELIDSLDPFSEGIVFSVRPPKKSWKNIANLSGGEKTLSSLALVFALHHYKPTPLYVMDEIDAALDFKNVSIVGNYLKERTKNAQFIVISLRNNMFELSDRLVGIYKTYNITKTITLDPGLMADQMSQLLHRVATNQGREKEYHQWMRQQQRSRLTTAVLSQSVAEAAVVQPSPSGMVSGELLVDELVASAPTAPDAQRTKTTDLEDAEEFVDVSSVSPVIVQQSDEA